MINIEHVKRALEVTLEDYQVEDEDDITKEELQAIKKGFNNMIDSLTYNATTDDDEDDD